MKKLYILIAVAIVIFGTVGFFQMGNFGTAALWTISNEGKWLLPLVSIAALIDSINPCAFSILLLTIAFLFSLGKMRSGILKIGSFYIFGLFSVYVLIGLGILQALHIFNTPHFMAKLGAALLILFGLINLAGHYFPKFPVKLKIPDAVHNKIARLMEASSLPTAFFLGALVGLCEFPCTGGPYLLVLGLLHDQATYLKGLGYLLIYNLIFILPLALILLIASEQSLLDKVQKWRKENTGSMKLWSSIAMIGLGIIIFMF